MGIRRIGVLFLITLVPVFIHPAVDAYGQEGTIRGLSRGAVGVAELSPQASRKSLQLQEAGLNALHHADYLGADRLLHQALALTPSAYAIYNNLAVGCAARSRLSEAAGWLEKAWALAPFDPIVAGNLGVIRWLQERTDESYNLLRTALNRGYNSGAAHFAMGVMALQREYPLEAVRNLSKANRTRFPARDLYLSLALRELGKVDAAAKNLRKFLEGNTAPWFLAAYSAY